jgi:Protein of unknown function (DUF3296).
MLATQSVLDTNKFIYSKNEISNNLTLTFKPNLDNVLCFNHYSIIQNFLKTSFSNNYVVVKSEPSQNINRNHDLQNRIKNIIIDKPKKLEDFDNLEHVKTAFIDYMAYTFKHPKIMHTHGYFDDGTEINSTWQALNRFQSNQNIKPLSEALANYNGPGVFLTLTIDPKKVNGLKDAWQTIAKRWNAFITRLSIELKKPRKELHYIWVLEAQQNGYPHIHALFLGIDYLFWAGNKTEWLNDNPHSKNIKHFWKIGGVFINSTKNHNNIERPIYYMMKYIRKTFEPFNPNDKKLLTQALLWVFNKRSWNTSRGIFQFLNYEPKIPAVDMELEEMLTIERLKGQYTPLVWIENKIDKNNPAYQSGETFTTSNEDLDYLAEKVSLFHASKSEQRALAYLLKYKNLGIEKSYTIYNLKFDNYLHRFKKHKLGT